VRVGSLPNISLQEFLLRLVAAGENPGHPLDVFIGGVPLDTFRKIGIRDSLIP
jgi:hypothetical protein